MVLEWCMDIGQSVCLLINIIGLQVEMVKILSSLVVTNQTKVLVFSEPFDLILNLISSKKRMYYLRKLFHLTGFLTNLKKKKVFWKITFTKIKNWRSITALSQTRAKMTLTDSSMILFWFVHFPRLSMMILPLSHGDPCTYLWGQQQQNQTKRQVFS